MSDVMSIELVCFMLERMFSIPVKPYLSDVNAYTAFPCNILYLHFVSV